MPKIGTIFRKQFISAAQSAEIDLDIVTNADALAAFYIIERMLIIVEFDRDSDAVALRKIGAIKRIVVKNCGLDILISDQMEKFTDAAVWFNRFIGANGVVGNFFEKGTFKFGKRIFIMS